MLKVYSIAAAAFSFAIFGAAPSSAAECTRHGEDWRFGASTTMTLTVSGSSCTWNLRPNGKTRLSSIKVTARPKNGSASAGVASVVYTAKPGFKGSDSFAVAVNGQGVTGTPGTANISVSVNVQ
ncbi:MAG: hypothetical protein ACHQAQ_07720 [Hyphomicrobiales bacterium]